MFYPLCLAPVNLICLVRGMQGLGHPVLQSSMATGEGRGWDRAAGSSGLSHSVPLCHPVGAFFGPLALGSLPPDAYPWNVPARQMILLYLPPCHQRILSVQGSQPSISSLGLKFSLGH